MPSESAPAPVPASNNPSLDEFSSSAPRGSDITRDESSKLVITEDDVRGLERGAVLRIAESARLTPLAADMINDRGIEIVRRVSRSGSKQSKVVAVGAAVIVAIPHQSRARLRSRDLVAKRAIAD